ncbi:MAG: DNA repair protein RadC [Nitrospinota bacterium]|nr:DNA repair protein RadC [Nitrospinota bacterium]
MTRGLSIKFWPDSERPRERLLERGGDAVSDAQLLAILLRTGDQGISALDLAIQLIDRFGGFEGIDRASVPELTELKGMGPAKSAQVKAALEISWRTGRNDEINKTAFHCGSDVHRFLSPAMASLAHEEFRVLLLDTKHRLMREVTVSRGTLSGTAVDPREVYTDAIREKAAAFVCGHNHPSGDPSPSPEDHALTARLRESGWIVGIPLLDHVIVGRQGYFRYDEEDWPTLK